KGPRQRYGSAKDLTGDLRRFLSGEPIRARPVSAWERGMKWVRRRPAVAALSAAIVLLTAGALTAVTILWPQTEAARDDPGHAWKEEAKRRAEVEATLAGQRVALAHRLYLAGDLAEAKRLLALCRNEHRDREWRYVHRLCNAELLRIKGSSSRLIFSPSGQRL